jgi:hypothetical protein
MPWQRFAKSGKIPVFHPMSPQISESARDDMCIHVSRRNRGPLTGLTAMADMTWPGRNHAANFS